MLLNGPITLILGLIHLCSAVLPNQLNDAKWEMDLFKDPDLLKDPALSSINTDWDLRPTWHKTYSWPASSNRKPNYVDALGIAEAYFNWVITQQSCRGGTATVIVSTMYDPVTNTFETATIPRGPRKEEMVAARNQAPRWYMKAARYVNGVPNRRGVIEYPYCAEDALAYNYETRQGNGLGANTGTTYNDGSFVAVWGTTKRGDTIGRELYPCLIKAGTKNVPAYAAAGGLLGCTTTMTNLGISLRVPEDLTDNPVVGRSSMSPFLPVDWPLPNWPPTTIQAMDASEGPPFEPSEGATEDDVAAAIGALSSDDSSPERRVKRYEPMDLKAESSQLDTKTVRIRGRACVARAFVNTTSSNAFSLDPSATSSILAGLWPVGMGSISAVPSGLSATTTMSTLSDITMSFPTPVTTETSLIPPVAAITATLSKSSSGSLTTSTRASCNIVNADPDSGVNHPYCLCEGSMTYPTLAMTADYSRICDYTTIPSSVAQITTNTSIYGPAVTNSAICEVTGQVGPNEDTASLISGCATPLIVTTSGYVLSYPGEDIVSPTATFAGGSTGAGVVTTIPEGTPSTISTLPPSITVLTSTGTGAFVGQMTGSDLWYNISTAVVSACSGNDWPVTNCPTATITGVPYPSDNSEFVGLDPEVGYGDFEISLTEVNFKDAYSLSLLAYNLGAAAALSIAHDPDSMCKNISTAQAVCGRTGCFDGPSSNFDNCFMPNSLLIQEYKGDNTYGPDSEVWASFEFTSPKSGDAIEVACQALESIADAALAFVMMFAWVIGPEGEVAAAGAEGAVDLDAVSADVATAAEGVQFGCASLEEFKKAAGTVKQLAAGGSLSPDVVSDLTQQFINMNQSANGFTQGVGQIGQAFDSLTKLFGQ